MRYARTPVLDEYIEEDEVAVMTTDGVVLALSPLASTALAALSDGPLDDRQVAEHLLRRFGAPPDTDLYIHVAEVLSVLSGAGLVALVSDD